MKFKCAIEIKVPVYRIPLINERDAHSNRVEHSEWDLRLKKYKAWNIKTGE